MRNSTPFYLIHWVHARTACIQFLHACADDGTRCRHHPLPGVESVNSFEFSPSLSPVKRRSIHSSNSRKEEQALLMSQSRQYAHWWFVAIRRKERVGNSYEDDLNGDIPHSTLSSNPVLWHDQGRWATTQSGCAGLPSSGGGRDQPGRLRHECQRSAGQVVAARATGL